MSDFNFSKEQQDQLLGMAAKRMGIDAQNLKNQMESGQMNSLLGGLSPAQQAQISSLMNNPQAVQQLVSNPKVQQLLKGLMGK